MFNPDMIIDDDDDDHLQSILAEHRREIMAAQTLESDLDFAFQLQLEEAVNASLALLASNSTAAPPPLPLPLPITNLAEEVSTNIASLQSDELAKLEQETRDHKHCTDEFKREKEDLHRRIHDQNFAHHITQIPEDDWMKCGDNYERPFGEGSSTSGFNGADEVFRIYTKGLVSEERVKGRKRVLSGIGVVICDLKDNVVFEIIKPLIGNGKSSQSAEIVALIEGFNGALALGLKRLHCFVDHSPLIQYVMRRWTPKQPKVAILLTQLFNLKSKFSHCIVTLIARNGTNIAFKLARESIVSQISDPLESSSGNAPKESCQICFDEVDIVQIFSVHGCLHRYCVTCLQKHMKEKLLTGILPKCPHANCNSELTIKNCKNILTPNLIDLMKQLLKEASIPTMQKIYCPYPKCSALMSLNDLKIVCDNQNSPGQCGQCNKCSCLFCFICKVPWHDNMSCFQYRMSNPYPKEEETKLKVSSKYEFMAPMC